VGADSLSGGAPAACAALLTWGGSKIAVAMPNIIAAFQLRVKVTVRIVIAPLIVLFLVVALTFALWE
jgi:hypothetical protein